MTSSQPKVWSFWVYDRHCSLIFHADWSSPHNRLLTNNESSQSSHPTTTASASTSSSSSPLPLREQAKLVYGVVYSLRNIVRKLSPLASTKEGNDGGQESLNSYSTSRYTLAHLQSPTKYTFLLLTDPIPPLTRRPPPPSSTSMSGSGSGFVNTSGIVGNAGGGIPNTAGMSTNGVLQQIVRGPWVEFVARNPGMRALERDLTENEEEEEEEEDGGDDGSNENESKEDIQRRRLEGLGKSIDSEMFKSALERVLAQNKLSAPRM